MLSKNNISILIAAAGKGSRANLPYPKTLYRINGKEILLRILDITKGYDKCPTIVISPSGKIAIEDFLLKNSRKSYLVIQEEARGMGDAVLKFENSPSFKLSENILLMWGDVPFIREETIQTMVKRHFEENNVFTFVTSETDKAYTRVIRDSEGTVQEIIETREENLPIEKGERDIGLFIFKSKEIFDLLKLDLPKKYSSKTNEHGFLYLVQHLIKSGNKVEGLKIANEKELLSLNKISDLNQKIF